MNENTRKESLHRRKMKEKTGAEVWGRGEEKVEERKTSP